ncbi:hypothetical protein EYF80_012498 [Liparis tanakae]|uniref:Uncharacterized protein n=1 Tax=Liparis tanakae TaxID=230148 RepID=A0A4Z2IJ43_9TELE|nr:hypothetical protein EYF80_012498 [Liparis tanakae]
MAIIRVLILTSEEQHKLQMALDEKLLLKGAGFNLVTVAEGSSALVFALRGGGEDLERPGGGENMAVRREAGHRDPWTRVLSGAQVVNVR